MIDKKTVFEIINPWSQSYVKAMTWGEILLWAQEHVNQINRRSWIDHARRAMRNGDAETIGIMIIGS